MPTSPKRPPGRNNFKYQPRYGVIVLCADEQHQRIIYEQLKAAGHKVKVVAV